jgi:poly(ADP-ribose) glycohydrolase ARH3
LQSGVRWNEAATVVFPDGSFGNGAAMRVAPIGVFYHDDSLELRRVAELSASITHGHPLGKEGAAVQAYAVACAVATKLEEFLGRVRSFVNPERAVYVQQLDVISELLRIDPAPEEVAYRLGHDVRAQTAVPAALYAFLAHPASFADAVRFAIMLGGDTDTIGAMAGAIAGAYHGVEAIPEKWMDALENTGKGRAYVMDLAKRLYERHAERRT